MGTQRAPPSPLLADSPPESTGLLAALFLIIFKRFMFPLPMRSSILWFTLSMPAAARAPPAFPGGGRDLAACRLHRKLDLEVEPGLECRPADQGRRCRWQSPHHHHFAVCPWRTQAAAIGRPQSECQELTPSAPSPSAAGIGEVPAPRLSEGPVDRGPAAHSGVCPVQPLTGRPLPPTLSGSTIRQFLRAQTPLPGDPKLRPHS